MRELEKKAKQYADYLFEGEFETPVLMFKKADIRVAYMQGFEDATKWHYPSKGDNPLVTGSYLVFAEGENGLQYAIGEFFAEENRERWMKAGEWFLQLEGVSGSITPIAWMPLPEPPKEEA